MVGAIKAKRDINSRASNIIHSINHCASLYLICPRIETEGDVDIRGFTGVSEKVRPGAQEFRMNIHLDSKTASKEQLEKLYELGRKFSPAIDTLTHGTTIKTTYNR